MKKQKDQSIKYLTVNTTDELWGLFVTTIGFQSIAPNFEYPPKNHPSAYWFKPLTGRMLDEYIMVYITKGEGTFQCAGSRTTKITGGTILLLFPGEWHTYKPSKITGWEEYWIGFNGSYINELVKNNYFSKNNRLINIGFNEQIIALFTQGIQTANYQNTAYQQMLGGILSMMLGFIFYSDKNNSFRDKAIVEQINKARMLMREGIKHDINPIEIAKSLNISYSWFRRVFKQYTGFSPAQYQLEIKVQKAKELLTSTSMPVKEISFELNFESVSYFVTFFKSKTGITPSEYRNKIKGIDLE